jgi:non-canonical (house-cleaning) NTP pyrophosphatase
MTRESFRPAASLVAALEGSPIGVGTQNGAKLEAVRAAFASFQASGCILDLIPVEVESGVSEQPIGFQQIRDGARNRARAAFEGSDAVLAVGIEDGLMRLSDHPIEEASAIALDEGGDVYYNVGCAWLTDGEREGHAFSAAFSYPRACSDPAIRDQLPIGDLFDTLWRAKRAAESSEKTAVDLESASGSDSERAQEPANVVASGRQGGNIGMLTGGRLERAAYGGQAVICALVRFLHTDLYD